jgi:tRNA-dihydrouridine synthase B
MRLGRTTPEEIFNLLPILDRYPLSEIVIHPRTARQMYGGRPDLATFERCLAFSRHRIVYNGDITDVGGFRALQARFPAIESWMIGRGALADPFLPAAIKNGPHAAADRVQRFKAFYDDLFDRTRERLSGPGHLLDRMKGFWTYFAAAFTEGPALAKEIHRTFQLPRYTDTVERFFQENAVWRN